MAAGRRNNVCRLNDLRVFSGPLTVGLGRKMVWNKYTCHRKLVMASRKICVPQAMIAAAFQPRR